MKEQRITIEIGEDGSLTADAEGFSGDVCVKDLEKLLAGLASVQEHLERKTPDSAALTQAAKLNRVKVGNKQ